MIQSITIPVMAGGCHNKICDFGVNDRKKITLMQKFQRELHSTCIIAKEKLDFM